MRTLTEKDVTFDLYCDPEDTPIEGNALASGDPATDREAEEWIRSELDRGNDWAWCTVWVVARWEGFEGRDCLGCCSYRSEKEFRSPDGYFPQMKEEALDRLNEKVRSLAEKVCPLFCP